MFAMLHGAWPLTADEADGDVRSRVEAAVRAQLDAGLELVSDGLVRWPEPAAALLEAMAAGATGEDGLLVRAWRETAEVGGGARDRRRAADDRRCRDRAIHPRRRTRPGRRRDERPSLGASMTSSWRSPTRAARSP
jgi:hypothetical protein